MWWREAVACEYRLLGTHQRHFQVISGQRVVLLDPLLDLLPAELWTRLSLLLHILPWRQRGGKWKQVTSQARKQTIRVRVRQRSARGTSTRRSLHKLNVGSWWRSSAWGSNTTGQNKLVLCLNNKNIKNTSNLHRPLEHWEKIRNHFWRMFF